MPAFRAPILVAASRCLFPALLALLCAVSARAHDDLAPHRAALSAATAQAPDDPTLWLGRAELARIAGDLPAAEAALDRAAALAPTSPGVARARAALALDRGDPATARIVVEHALAGPGLPADDLAALAFLAARIAEEQDRPDDALAAYDRALAATSRPTAEAFLARAALARAHRGPAEAARGLEFARMRLPYDGAVLDALARDLEATGRGAEAAALLATWDPTGAPDDDDGWIVSPRPGDASASVRAPAPAPGVVPTIVRGPYLQNGTVDAITIRWRTDIATDSRVWLGETPGALSPVVTDPSLTTEHELRVTGLAPGTRYAYAVGASDALLAGDNADHTFRTAAVPGQGHSTRVWVLGDSGRRGVAQDRVRDAYLEYTGEKPTDVWLMLGDNAYQTGTDQEFGEGLFDPYAAILRGNVLWPTRGNHDFIHLGDANDYYDLFTMPVAGEAGGTPSSSEAWYSFDHGDVHFMCLDSEGSSRTPGSPMLTWLAADLAANQRTWTIAYFHHPPYTKGSHDSDNVGDSGGRMRDMRENVMPLLEAGGVDLVLSGHSHSYERSYLLDGHYGLSGTLTPAMILDDGDGDPDGDGAYAKPGTTPAPHQGEVVAVAGSSSLISGGTLDHPVMVRSLNVLGSLVIDVQETRLEGFFLDDEGEVRDVFAIAKGAVVDSPGTVGPAIALRVAGANPFRGVAHLDVDLPRPGQAELRLVDAAGRRVRRIASGDFPAGPRTFAWDGNEESGRRAPAGLYFAILDAAGGRRVARLIRLD